MISITWREWLMTALARRLGLNLYHFGSGEGGITMLFATSRGVARDAAEHYVVSEALAHANQQPVLTVASSKRREVRH